MEPCPLLIPPPSTLDIQHLLVTIVHHQGRQRPPVFSFERVRVSWGDWRDFTPHATSMLLCHWRLASRTRVSEVHLKQLSHCPCAAQGSNSRQLEASGSSRALRATRGTVDEVPNLVPDPLRDANVLGLLALGEDGRAQELETRREHGREDVPDLAQLGVAPAMASEPDHLVEAAQRARAAALGLDSVDLGSDNEVEEGDELGVSASGSGVRTTRFSSCFPSYTHCAVSLKRDTSATLDSGSELDVGGGRPVVLSWASQ